MLHRHGTASTGRGADKQVGSKRRRFDCIASRGHHLQEDAVCPGHVRLPGQQHVRDVPGERLLVVAPQLRSHGLDARLRLVLHGLPAALLGPHHVAVDGPVRKAHHAGHTCSEQEGHTVSGTHEGQENPKENQRVPPCARCGNAALHYDAGVKNGAPPPQGIVHPGPTCVLHGSASRPLLVLFPSGDLKHGRREVTATGQHDHPRLHEAPRHGTESRSLPSGLCHGPGRRREGRTVQDKRSGRLAWEARGQG